MQAMGLEHILCHHKQIRSLMTDRVWGTSQGGRMTTSPGLRMVTALLPLETSIPTAFTEDTPLERISNHAHRGLSGTFRAFGIFPYPGVTGGGKHVIIYAAADVKREGTSETEKRY